MQDVTSYPSADAAARSKQFIRQQSYSSQPSQQYSFAPRPQSQDGSDDLETDFEDDDASEASHDYDEDVEQSHSQKGSFESDDRRRRSQTTISSYNEVPTPDPVAGDDDQFEIRFRPVQGPSGPHLFRFSSISAEMEFKNALQMSPIIGPKSDPFASDLSTRLDETGTPSTATFLGGMSFEAAFQQTEDDHDDVLMDQEGYIRSWSPQEVIDWMYDAALDTTIIEAFAKHDITGTVLLDLEFDDLKELDIPSFGKRHQLWSAICVLRGDEKPAAVPAQEGSRAASRASRRSNQSRSRQNSAHCVDEDVRRDSQQSTSSSVQRRGRKPSHENSHEVADEVLPAESVSIVAIEQLLPKAHNCAKGENCSKWRKQQRQLQQLRDEHGIDYFPDHAGAGGRIVIASNGVQGSPSAAPEEVRILNPHLLQPSVQECLANIPFRPNSEAMPSVVASSGLFGVGQEPEFTAAAVQESNLSQLGTRDPQDNVKQFLNFQHMNSPAAPGPDFPPASPALEMFPSRMIAPFPAAHQQPPQQSQQLHTATNTARSSTASPPEQLRSLPKLNIPRSTSAGPTINQRVSPKTMAQHVQRSMTPPSPVVSGPIYRHGTPASEMDVPYMAAPMAAPISRDASQSVPPNMQFNPPTRLSNSHSRTSKNDWRRPSMALPALREGEVVNAPSPPASRNASHELSRSTSVTRRSNDSSSSTSSSTRHQRRQTLDPAKDDPELKHFGYGPDCSHAGWMRKRKTKMLRHEWQAAHFRLKGTQLAMHENARLTSAARETIDVEHYAVACASVASTSKLSAAMKALHIRSSSTSTATNPVSDAADPTAFAFQLVPTQTVGEQIRKGGVRAAVSAATSGAGLPKTHHFAVHSKDERIDWMRELMIAKALQQKGNGYEVEVNGVVA